MGRVAHCPPLRCTRLHPLRPCPQLMAKVDRAAVAPHAPRMLRALVNCFKDDSWPVRDASCTACGRCVEACPEESKEVLPELLPLWIAHLWDNIPTVRQNSAQALGKVCQAYGADAIATCWQAVDELLPKAFDQPRRDSMGDAAWWCHCGCRLFGVMTWQERGGRRTCLRRGTVMLAMRPRERVLSWSAASPRSTPASTTSRPSAWRACGASGPTTSTSTPTSRCSAAGASRPSSSAAAGASTTASSASRRAWERAGPGRAIASRAEPAAAPPHRTSPYLSALTQEPWEASDGAVWLLLELAPVDPAGAEKRLGTLAQLAGLDTFMHAYALKETVFKALPGIARAVGKRAFKSHLEEILPPAFRALTSGHQLAEFAAGQCLGFIRDMIGPNILAGRLSEEQAALLRTSPLVPPSSTFGAGAGARAAMGGDGVPAPSALRVA